jgi:hypothetical protein
MRPWPPDALFQVRSPYYTLLLYGAVGLVEIVRELPASLSRSWSKQETRNKAPYCKVDTPGVLLTPGGVRTVAPSHIPPMYGMLLDTQSSVGYATDLLAPPARHTSTIESATRVAHAPTVGIPPAQNTQGAHG